MGSLAQPDANGQVRTGQRGGRGVSKKVRSSDHEEWWSYRENAQRWTNLLSQQQGSIPIDHCADDEHPFQTARDIAGRGERTESASVHLRAPQ